MKLKPKDLVRHEQYGLGVILSIEYQQRLIDDRSKQEVNADVAWVEFEDEYCASLCDFVLQKTDETLNPDSHLYQLLHPKPPPVYVFEPLPEPVLPEDYVREKTYGSQFAHLSDTEKQAMIPHGDVCYSHVAVKGNETFNQGRLGHEQREFEGFYFQTKGLYCPFYNYTEYGTVCCEYLDLEFIYDEVKICQHFKTDNARQIFHYPFGIFDDMYKLCRVNMDWRDEDWDIMGNQ